MNASMKKTLFSRAASTMATVTVMSLSTATKQTASSGSHHGCSGLVLVLPRPGSTGAWLAWQHPLTPTLNLWREALPLSVSVRAWLATNLPYIHLST